MAYSAYPQFSPPRWPGTQPAPVGWEVQRLKFAVTCNDEALSEGTDPDYEMAYVDISSVNLVEGIKTIETLPFEEAPSRARRIVRHGDTIISTVRTYLRAIAAIEEPPTNMIVSTGFAVMRPMEFIDSGFLGYALQGAAFIDAVVANSTGVSYPAISPTTLVCLPFGYPDCVSEQQQIATFLDWKTGQIDALIGKKKELLEKLKEKRLAVITEAVTQGLNPAAPMRDSGIPSLGHVPRHWKVKRLRFACSRIEQGWSPQCDNQPADEDSWGVMKVGCVNRDLFNPEENKRLPRELEPALEYELKAGDILISRANTSELLGSAALVPAGTRDKLLLCDKLFRVSPETEIRNDFLTFFLRTPVARFQYEREATGASSSMKNIGQDTIKDVPTTIPPLPEQAAICDFIRERTGKLDSLVAAVETAIARLAEYRTALITAATTGKIDVRKVKIPRRAA